MMIIGNKKISYCQGDGACFINNSILSYTNIKNKKDLNAFEKWLIDNLNEEEMMLLLDYLNSGYNLDIIKISHHYEHARTCRIDYEYFYSSDDPEYLNRINYFISELCDRLFENVYISICKDLEEFLYKNYEVSEEEAIEEIKQNECLFMRDGSLFKEVINQWKKQNI